VPEWLEAFPLSVEFILEQQTGFAKIMEKPGDSGQKSDGLHTVKSIFAVRLYNIPLCGIGRHCPFVIKLANISDYPKHFSLII